MTNPSSHFTMLFFQPSGSQLYQGDVFQLGLKRALAKLLIPRHQKPITGASALRHRSDGECKTRQDKTLLLQHSICCQQNPELKLYQGFCWSNALQAIHYFYKTYKILFTENCRNVFEAMSVLQYLVLIIS